MNPRVLDVRKRELGQITPRTFANRVSASEDFVLRFDIARKLRSHRGCVNTLDFNSDGNILATGSDDRLVKLWDWETGSEKLSCVSGHHGNVFQAKFMPYSEDRSIVTCAADGQVRHIEIMECGKVESTFLCKHRGGAHKLAIEPGSPHNFYTCGEDGVVQHIDLRTRTSTKLGTCLSKRDNMHAIQLHSIALDPRNPNLFAVSGTDSCAYLYDIRKYQCDGTKDFGQPVDLFCPLHLVGDVDAGITGLAFSEQSELLVSYNDESIYLFQRDMGLGPNPAPASKGSDTTESSSNSVNDLSHVVPTVFEGHRNLETVKGVFFFGPKCEYVMSGSDCGRIFIWKKKDGELMRVMEADRHVVNYVEPHPHHIPVLASSGIENDIKIWVPKAMERATLPTKIDMPARRQFFPVFGDLIVESREGTFIFSAEYADDDDDDDEDDEDDDDDGDNIDFGEDGEDVDSEYGTGFSDDEMDDYDSFDSGSEQNDELNGDVVGDPQPNQDEDDEIAEELQEHVGGHADNSYLSNEDEDTSDT